jgi:CBS domain-containing protein
MDIHPRAYKGWAMTLKVIPDIVENQALRCLNAEDKAFEAARHMETHDISSILVVDQDNRLVGIVTERDIARKIVAAAQDPMAVTVGDIMTADPDVIAPADSPKFALDLMRARRCRHLPIVDGEELKGIVSMRDLRKGLARRSLMHKLNIGRWVGGH